MSEPHHNVAQVPIETSLRLEKLDTNLFRSTSLYKPLRGRGVFGGQVISQAVVAATKCVDAEFGLHSLHCYFVLSADVTIPILYYVERLRDGRSYVTRSVKAVQNGRIIFSLLCSFQRPEPHQPMHQWPMPDVPPPEECELEEDQVKRRSQDMSISENNRKYLAELVVERASSPASIKLLEPHRQADGTMLYMWWMKVKDRQKYEPPFQKCILGYLSDFHFVGVAANSLGLKRLSKGPNALGMMSSLDHSMFFYEDDFDCGDWILHVANSMRTGSGRGVVTGRMYTRQGKLIAVSTQEGVIRADIREPVETKSKL